MSLFRGFSDRRLLLDLVLLLYVSISLFLRRDVPSAVEVALVLFLLEQIRRELPTKKRK
jgi:hypothetical protein